MNADPRVQSQSGAAAPSAEALYFDSGGHRLFGWHHRPSAGAMADVGLVVCKPFGYEALCAHRSVRAFAEAAAQLGMPTLRFDYAGTGDSSEIESQADQVAIWTEDIIAAVAELKRRSSVKRVYLLGIRLGALLAPLAVSRCKGVDGLILIAPIVSGRRYLRELRTTRLAASIGSEAVELPKSATTDGAAAGAGAMEVSGFVLSAATLASIAQIDLKALGALPVANTLVIDGSQLPVARAWVEDLSRLGAPPTHLFLPGLVEMLMTAPQFASVPQTMIAAMRGWLTPLLEGSRIASGRDNGRPVEFSTVLPIEVMNLPFEGPRDHALTERPIFLPSPAVVFGIVTEPAPGEKPRGAVILVNAGADYHIGPSGIYVELARHWARHGYIVLRMDLAGLGDSGTLSGQADNEVFPPEALSDIRAAVDHLRTRYGIQDVALGGLCSGAYHALRAAVASISVNPILMINPETFYWDDSMSIHDVQLVELVGKTGHRNQVFSAAGLKRLLSGRVDIHYILGVYARRGLLSIESNFRELARRLHIRLRNDLGWELERIAARQVRMVFVFSRGERGIALLKLQSGISLNRLGKCLRMHIIDGADHVFSKTDSRMALQQILSDELFSPNK
jgi:alpha-beta hydrolase superfamily lysophospholipase